MHLKQSRGLIIIGLVVLLAGSIGIYLWNQSFRVESVTPNPAPLSVTQIEFKFSQPLAPGYDTSKITISNSVKGTFKLNAQSIIFEPADSLPESTLSFTFKSIRSVRGDQADLTSRVVAKYVPFNQLSAAEQKRQVDKSSSLQGTYPIASYLPHAATTWKAEFTLPENSHADKLTIIVTPFIDKGTNESDADFDARLEDVRKEFENYITTNGFKLTDYYLLYSNEYLAKYDHPAPNGDLD